MTVNNYTHSPHETEALGEALARQLIEAGHRRAFIAMRGEMGVGKTAFARGFGRALGADRIKSPTYTVVSEHKGDPVPFFHFDTYRIQDSDDLWSIGYDDYLARDGYILCEWSENIEDDVPDGAIYVTISRTDDGCGRQIVTEGL